MDLAIDFTLLALLSLTALAIVRQTNLFAAVTLTSIFSLLSAALFTVMDAVDVAFTEAAVGAGISTVLFLASLSLVGSRVRTPQFRMEDISAKIPIRRPIFPLLVVVITGGILVFGTLDMPPFGSSANPVHHHVADHYLEDSEEEIGIPNVVTAVLASYRGYDTLGETAVVFTAAVGVMILLSGLRRRDHLGQEAWGEEGVHTLDPGMGASFEVPGNAAKDGGASPTRERRWRTLSDQVILKVATKIVLPAILLFALYVQFHGDFGAGGGFQAGVIAAAGFILYALVFGLRRTQNVLPSWLVRFMASLGVLWYAGVGVASLFLGGAFLDYGVLGVDAHHGQHLGILLVEMGVLVTVFGVMLTIFYFFAARGREDL